jgi:exodeoxyribonuclease VIII
VTDDDYAKYAQIDAVNWSTLKEMQKSPKHYQHRLKNPRKDTAAMMIGRATHTAVFEPDRFALEYAVFKGERRAGKVWEAFKESHATETILKIDDYKRCIAIRDAVRSHPGAASYLTSGVAEQTITWTDQPTGIKCKGRYDWYARDRKTLVDLKTTRDVSAFRFAASAARLSYHAQLAFYVDGLSFHVGDALRVVIIAVESEDPFDVAVYHLDEDVLYAGREEYRDLLEKVRGCRQLGAWPGRFTEEQSLELPAWAFGDDEITDDDGIVFGSQEATNGL